MSQIVGLWIVERLQEDVSMNAAYYKCLSCWESHRCGTAEEDGSTGFVCRNRLLTPRPVIGRDGTAL